MEAQKKFPTIDNYQLIKTLGSGLTAKVKLAIDMQTGKQYAIKIFKKNNNFDQNKSTLTKEFLIMQGLNHINLIRLIEIKENCDYNKRNGTVDKRMAIVIEYAGGGELFEYVSQCGKFTDSVARFYFNQILDGLQYLHGQGIAHRDMKPENLLFDDNFILKLSDFGFSAHTQGNDKSGFMHTVLGTESYMAPEIATKNYKGEQVDLFASAIILFIMITGHPPFTKADKTDPFYKLLMTQKHETFWKAHSRNKPQGFWTNELKDLFNHMFAFNPIERYTLSELRKHPWVTGTADPFQDIQKEFSRKKQLVDAQIEKQRLEKQKAKEQQQQNNQGKQAMFTGVKFRSGEETEKEFQVVEQMYITPLEQKKQLVKQLGELKASKAFKQSDIVTVTDPEYLAKYILKYSSKFCSEIQLVQNNLYHLQCLSKSDFDGLFEQPIEAKFDIKFLKIDDDKLCVDLIENKEVSNHVLFLQAKEQVSQIVNELLGIQQQSVKQQ